MLEYRRPDLVAERPLLAMPARFFHFYTAIVLPIVCFAMSAVSYPPGPEWQAGRWHDYLGLIPTAKVGWAFYPLLVFSMYAAIATVIRPARAIQLVSVRVGLFTGVILALQYSIIQIVSLSNMNDGLAGIMAALAISVGSVAVLLFLGWLAGVAIWNRKWYRGRGKIIFWGTAVALAAGGLLIARSPMEPLIAFCFSQLIIAPLLTLTTFVALSLLVIRRGTFLAASWPGLSAGLIGWGAAFTAAWVKAYQEAVLAYAALPTSRPGCYIATAAAQGHGRIVKSWPVGKTRMNGQLAILKVAEIKLAEHRPMLHRSFRLVYDRIGPPLARQMQNRWIADLAYLTLKPIEWMTVAMLIFSRQPITRLRKTDHPRCICPMRRRASNQKHSFSK